MKKLTKQIISIALGAVTAASCGTMAFAADKTLNQDTPSGSSTVEYSEVSTYTATIPEYIHPAELGEQNTSAYSISIDKAVIATGETVSASVSYDGMLETGDGAKLPYTLYSDAGAIVSGSKIIEKSAGSEDVATFSFGAALNERARYSGNYSDTTTFSFSVAEKAYTLDEINANEHLYAIGKTKREYVVAKFNDDYTEIKIFKNGENSDGLMRDGTVSVVPGSYENNTTTETGGTISSNNKTKKITIMYGVTSVGNIAFRDFSNLTNIVIPDSVTSIGERAFAGCSNLMNIMIPDNVTSIGTGAFWNCSNLVSITIPNGITSIKDSTFSACTNLTNIVIPDSVTSIGNSAFTGCSNLMNITIPDNVTNIGRFAFRGCSKLASVTIPSGVTSIGERTFSECTNLTSIIIPKAVTNIGDFAFWGCSNLTNIVIPDGITSIGKYAFFGCSKLTSVTIPSGVTSIGERTFSECTNLTSITIPASVTNIATNAFKNCNLLKTVYGTTGSYAESWAKNNGYTFIAQ